MSEHQERDRMVEDTWRKFLMEGKHTKEFRYRHMFGLLPSNPRCRFCNAPFRGLGGRLMKVIFDKRRSNLNPVICDACEHFAAEYQGGAEVELSLLFADVRGSATLAENMTTSEFSQLINRFYKAVTNVLIRTDALIDKLFGDQAAGMYVPGFAGDEHADRAIEAAKEVLRVTGHGDSGGPWIPLGVGVHMGTAFVGSVRSQEGTTDITVLGDVPNTAARPASSAAAGEILVSEASSAAAGLDVTASEKRVLELKGKNEPVTAYVISKY